MTQEIYDINISWLQNDLPAHASFCIQAGVTALIGPSGAGKTTVARILTGLKRPTHGYIRRNHYPLFDDQEKINIPTSKRKIGYVSQEPALFPTMNVEQNILISSKLSVADLEYLYNLAGIAELLSRNPSTLSGGEARRVSIVRALAAKPLLLILDEPMNGLDPMRRKSLLTLIRQLSIETDTPTLLITHQIEEILLAADHGVLIADNQTSVTGPIEHVLSAPQTSELLGIDDAGSILETEVSNRTDGLLSATIGSQEILLSDEMEKIGSRLRLRILARDISVSTKHLKNVSILNQLEGVVSELVLKEQDQLLCIALKGSEQSVWARITNKSMKALQLKKGDTVYALIKAVAVKEIMTDAP
ncbi:MAG: molybdenum ABC transporter ATP-binding protein [Kordiimonas sp.]